VFHWPRGITTRRTVVESSTLQIPHRSIISSTQRLSQELVSALPKPRQQVRSGSAPLAAQPHKPRENLVNDGTLALASEYLSIIDIPGVNPLDRICFCHRFFASITSIGISVFWASDVAPLCIDLDVLYYSITSLLAPMISGRFFWTLPNILCSK
jgi:hypothetical protein